jgi:hypothetical protein
VDILQFVDSTSKVQKMWLFILKVREKSKSVISVRRVWFPGPIIPNLKYHATSFFSRMHRLAFIPKLHTLPVSSQDIMIFARVLCLGFGP